MDLKDKKVTVIGLGKSGIAACNLLIDKGSKVSITDCLDNPRVRQNIRNLSKKDIVNIEIGRHTEALIETCDLVVVSPGVPQDCLPIMWARRKNIPVISEIELAFIFCPAPIIAITGTNGKTTVATLVSQIFHEAGKKYVVCGNIGNPFSGELSQITNEHTVILEVSSFQLETIDRFKPKVAVMLNLGVDHLDRYTDTSQYFAAKSRIFSNQSEDDWAIVNRKDPECVKMAAGTKAKVLYFPDNKYINAKHLNSNHLAALMISSLFGIPEDMAIDICFRFKGIEHRMERVAEVSGVTFINDSKATNVGSTLWALNSIKRPIILIAGGKDKGSDFTVIKEELRNKVKAMILLGEARERIKETFQDLVPIQIATTLSHAVWQAFRIARSGDCVLFSPMCSSFDMFTDFAERGRVFKEAVFKL